MTENIQVNLLLPSTLFEMSAQSLLSLSYLKYQFMVLDYIFLKSLPISKVHSILFSS